MMKKTTNSAKEKVAFIEEVYTDGDDHTAICSLEKF